MVYNAGLLFNPFIIIPTAFTVFFIVVVYAVNKQYSLSFISQILLGMVIAVIFKLLGVSEIFALLGIGISLSLIYWMPK